MGHMNESKGLLPLIIIGTFLCGVCLLSIAGIILSAITS
tara:strand:+ start:1710 stop:1826 length:117 start_codon:yes stop_codon:yes gene_type:complete